MSEEKNLSQRARGIVGFSMGILIVFLLSLAMAVGYAETLVGELEAAIACWSIFGIPLLVIAVISILRGKKNYNLAKILIIGPLNFWTVPIVIAYSGFYSPLIGEISFMLVVLIFPCYMRIVDFLTPMVAKRLAHQ